MLTVAQVAADMFGLLGCERTPPALSLINRVLHDIQTTRSLLFLHAGSEKIIQQPGGFLLNGPTTVTVNATKGATALTSTGGLATWMDGCTATLSTDPSQNQLRLTASNVWALVYPYAGPTGAVSLTIYNDCVTMPAGCISIERPVEIEGFQELVPITNPAQLRESAWGFGWGYGGFTDSGRLGAGIQPGGYPTLSSARNPATPLTYFAHFLPDYSGIQTLRMRLDPMTDAEYLLKYWTKCLPSAITTVTDTTTLLVPFGVDEGIFLPIARNYLKSHPSFVADRNLTERDAVAARQALALVTNISPQDDVEIDVYSYF